MGVEGESQLAGLVAQELFLVTLGALRGHLNQSPAPGQLPLRKTLAAPASSLQ